MEPTGVEKRLGTGGRGAVWVAVVFATALIGEFQHRTGPTYPVSIDTAVGGASVSGKLPRTQAGAGGPTILLKVPDPAVAGEVRWRPHVAAERYRSEPMKRAAEELSATLPHFLPAAKIDYTVRLRKGAEFLEVPTEPAVLRYRNEVPALLLTAHILMMFAGLLFGFRIALAALLNEESPQWWFKWLIPALVLGGFVLGPMMSWYSFGEIWSGWPVGHDVTDTKTLLTTLMWLIAWPLAVRSPKLRRGAILAALVVMMAVYLVPHSVSGSEMDWSKTQPAAWAGHAVK